MQKFKSGDILTVITSDTEKISDMYSLGTVTTFLMATQFIATIGLIIYYNIYVAIFAIVCVLIGAAVSNATSKKIAKYSVELQKITGSENSSIIETFEGARTLKQLKKEEYFYNEYKGILHSKMGVAKKLALQVAFYADVFMFVNNIMPFATVLISLVFVINGTMTVGQLVAILSIAGALTEPVTFVGDLISKKRVADTILKKDKEFLNPTISDNRTTFNSLEDFKDLTFYSTGYSFGERVILKDVDFKLEKGKVYALVGESGKGKSTIYNIISKFIDQKDVDVRINNIDLNDISSAAVYDKIIQVDQKAFTINKSVLENITLGDNFTDEEIDEVIKVSQLENFQKQKGLDFVIDSRGENVSGGEKQRISIARMLIRKPDLILLDEPTSALDENTSENFVKALIEFTDKYNITVVAITHRNDFTLKADEIINI
ncbi:MAG: ABC transporter ATP-binding protein [Ezakiella sp.]|nr:ABC transporter ATP-binding protein [Ezakiella sp.]